MRKPPQPATIFNDIFAEVKLLAVRGRPPSELESKRLEHEISKLRAVDASGAFELSAFLALACGNETLAIEQYEKALAISSAADVLDRYVYLLEHIHDGKRLHDLYQRRAAQIRATPDLLRAFRDAFGICGLLQSSRDLETQMKTLGMEAEWGSINYLQILQSGGFNEWDLQAPIEFAGRFLRDRGIESRQTRSDCLDKEHQRPTIMYEFCVNLDPTEVVAAEEELYTQLSAKNFPIEASGLLVLGLFGDRGRSDDIVG